MDSRDQDFLKDYKPLHVPHKYEAGSSLQDNVIYALAQLQYATAPEVAAKLYELEPGIELHTHEDDARNILGALYNKGLIKGNGEPEIQYNLSKIEVQNSGKADELF